MSENSREQYPLLRTPDSIGKKIVLPNLYKFELYFDYFIGT